MTISYLDILNGCVSHQHKLVTWHYLKFTYGKIEIYKVFEVPLVENGRNTQTNKWHVDLFVLDDLTPIKYYPNTWLDYSSNPRQISGQIYVPSVYLFVYICVFQLEPLSGNYVYYSHSMNSINQIKFFSLKIMCLRKSYP